MGSVATLTRPSGTLSHRMGEGWGEGKGVAPPADCSAPGRWSVPAALRERPRLAVGDARVADVDWACLTRVRHHAAILILPRSAAVSS